MHPSRNSTYFDNKDVLSQSPNRTWVTIMIVCMVPISSKYISMVTEIKKKFYVQMQISMHIQYSILICESPTDDQVLASSLLVIQEVMKNIV